MSSFTKSPPLKLSPDGEMWMVAESFKYYVGSEDSDEVIEVPKGFMSDGASIPKIFWSLIGGPTGKYFYAAILHDYLYYTKTYKRWKADKIFYEAMGVLGVPNWKRSIMHLAVRLFGFIPWKNRKPFIGGLQMACILICILNISCARYNPATKTMYSLFGGRYKDKDVEFEAYPPIKDLISINAIKE